jgi:hypothetical protein
MYNILNKNVSILFTLQIFIINIYNKIYDEKDRINLVKFYVTSLLTKRINFIVNNDLHFLI